MVNNSIDRPNAESGISAMPQARLAYSVTEAASIIGLGKTTLYGLIGTGRLPSSKIGSRRVIRRCDLEALLTVEERVVHGVDPGREQRR